MKKLMGLMVVMGLFVINSGSALATEPVPGNWDSRSVWSEWFDNNGSRISEQPGAMETTGGMERKVSTGTSGGSEMKGEAREFDFIRETKTYDYTKDRGNRV